MSSGQHAALRRCPANEKDKHCQCPQRHSCFCKTRAPVKRIQKRMCRFPNTNLTWESGGRVRRGANETSESRGTGIQRPGVSTGHAAESMGPAKVLLRSEPQFSSSTKWGQTGEMGSRASRPGVHVSHVLFLAPDAGPAPGLQSEKPPDPPRQTSPSSIPKTAESALLSQPGRGQFPVSDGQASTPGAGKEGWTDRQHISQSLPGLSSLSQPHGVAS